MDEIDSIGSSRLEGGSGGKIWLFVCFFVFIYLLNVISWLLLTSAGRGTVHVIPRCCCRALNIFLFSLE